MKFGAMRYANSLSALMIASDDHDSALSAAPKPRHHLQMPFKKVIKYQIDNELRWMLHNHPSGDPQPSRADIELTRDIADAGRKLGLAVHDHIIIGASGHSSMRALGLL